MYIHQLIEKLPSDPLADSLASVKLNLAFAQDKIPVIASPYFLRKVQTICKGLFISPSIKTLRE